MPEMVEPERGDLLKFEYEGEVVHGTFLRFKPIFGNVMTEIQSGRDSVWVDPDDVICLAQRKDDRDTDIPMLSEELRLSGGVSH